MWHVNPLLVNYHEISNYTTAVTRHQPSNGAFREVRVEML
jgi:hypothetical protein